jgi:hypothetical protein
LDTIICSFFSACSRFFMYACAFESWSNFCFGKWAVYKVESS